MKNKAEEIGGYLMAVHVDDGKHTCIQVDRSETHVKFIAMNVATGFKVEELSMKDFEAIYKVPIAYQVERAAALYVEYAKNCGAAKEAMDYLGHAVKISKKEYEMVVTKKPAVVTAKETKAAKAAAVKEPVTKAKPAPAVKPAKPVKVAPVAKAKEDTPPWKGEKKIGIGAFCIAQIEAGKDNAAILEMVKKEYPSAATTNASIAWYRNKLNKGA